MLAAISWYEMFVPSVSPLEIVLRGTIMYLAILLLLRVVLRRQSGNSVSTTDILVVVLLSDAAQNGMAGEYRSITEGIVLVAVIIFWSYVLDLLGYRFPWLERLLHPAPLLLIKNGRLLRRNLRQELITIEELMSMLRKQGIEDVSEVASACMEPDGEVSVVKADQAE